MIATCRPMVYNDFILSYRSSFYGRIVSNSKRKERHHGKGQNITVEGGCNGNLKGICSLIRGQRAEDVIPRLRGTQCGMRGTSCPDQIAIALQEALDEEAGA